MTPKVETHNLDADLDVFRDDLYRASGVAKLRAAIESNIEVVRYLATRIAVLDPNAV
jgi:hypothetical protein